MTHSTLTTNLSRRALQFAALFLAVAPLFGSEPVASAEEPQLIGEMVVTATREPSLMGHLVVTAVRPLPAYVAVTDLGVMTVTAIRETVVASNDSLLAWHVAP